MKYSVDKNRLKEFIKKKLGVDLTGRISMITSAYSIPKDIRGNFILDDSDYKRILNQFGPMYYIIGNKSNFLVQPREKKNWVILKNNPPHWESGMDQDIVLNDIGIKLGITLGDIIDMYLPDDEDMLESINESLGFINVMDRFMSITYPNFSMQNAKIETIKKTIPGEFVPKIIITYRDPETDYLFAKYWVRYKEIQLNGDIFLNLENNFSDHMDNIVSWFNNEFNQKALTVTY